jgi:hypothetical protein
MPGASRNSYRQRALALAQDLYRRAVERWRETEQPQAEQLYRNAAARFIELANGFLARLADSGDSSLAALPRALGPEAGFRARSTLYYTEMMTLTTRPLLTWVIDALSPRSRFEASIKSATIEYLERLLVANTARVRSDFDERVLESRRRLEAEVRTLLSEVYASAERALEAVRARVAAGEAAVQVELARLDMLRREAVNLRDPEGEGMQPMESPRG